VFVQQKHACRGNVISYICFNLNIIFYLLVVGCSQACRYVSHAQGVADPALGVYMLGSRPSLKPSVCMLDPRPANAPVDCSMKCGQVCVACPTPKPPAQAPGVRSLNGCASSQALGACNNIFSKKKFNNNKNDNCYYIFFFAISFYF